MTLSFFGRCRPLIAIGLVGVVLVSGCGGEEKPAIPVQGQLFYKGSEPAAGALVVFHPVSSDTSTIKPTGEVKEDGSFTLTTYRADDGAPAGEYTVTVVWLEKKTGAKLGEDHGLAKDRLCGRYKSSGTTKLKATVNGTPTSVRLDVD